MKIFIQISHFVCFPCPTLLRCRYHVWMVLNWFFCS